MATITEKYAELKARGFVPIPDLPPVELPLPDGVGRFFGFNTASGPVTIYSSPQTGAFEVHGAILATYMAQGGPQSALGYPISDESDEDGVGRVSEFQLGSIFWASATGKTTTMITGPVATLPSSGVRFLNFLNSGIGLTGKTLGPTEALTFIQNAVELQFNIDPAVHGTHRNFQPVQWAGPEIIWVMHGAPGTAAWELHSSNNGTGIDGPLPENVFTSPTIIAYYDAPGPDLLKFLAPRCSRLWVVQNFTGWIVGNPLAGGPAERLSEVAAWHSIMNLLDPKWNIGVSGSWQRLEGSQSAQGWGDTTSPPT